MSPETNEQEEEETADETGDVLGKTRLQLPYRINTISFVPGHTRMNSFGEQQQQQPAAVITIKVLTSFKV